MDRYQLTLLPLVCVTIWFVIALGVFVAHTRRHGLPVDDDIEGRPASLLLGRYLRHYLMWVLAPWERTLVRWRVTPNTLTLGSLAAAAGSGIALALGSFAAGGWLYLIAGILDILDGRVARATGRVTHAGAFFDSVIDRYAEMCVFAGLAVYYRGTWVLGAVLLAASGSLMVSYVRARGESLGVDVKVGMMQRPERLLYLGALLAHSPLWEAFRPSGSRPLYPPAVVALLLLGVSASVTAVRRIVHTMRRLDAAPSASLLIAAAALPIAPAALVIAPAAVPIDEVAGGEVPAANAPVDGVPRRAPGAAAAAGTRRLPARLRPVG